MDGNGLRNCNRDPIGIVPNSMLAKTCWPAGGLLAMVVVEPSGLGR
jgi:hypothetical protein